MRAVIPTRTKGGVCEVAQQVKGLAAKPGDLNLIPGSHMVLQQVVL